jgi:hypothetical protein
MSTRHVSPASQWSEPQGNTRIATPVYLTATGVGGRMQVSDTGPADAFWNDSGVGDRYQADDAATSNDTSLFLLIGTRAVVR